MIKIFIIAIFILVDFSLYSQTKEFFRSLESIKPMGKEYFEVLKKERLLVFVGFENRESILFYGEDEDYNGTIYKYSTQTEKMFGLDHYSLLADDNLNGISLNISSKGLFYSRFFLNDPIDYGYQKIYLNYLKQDYFLDSIYNADKLIHSSFSSDGRYLLVNTLNTLSDYYNSEQDNRIMVYDLKDIEQGKIGKDYIPCEHCSDSYLIGDQLFFTVGRKDGYDGFSNKDIYVAPWGSLKDSVKIADNTDILAISPDGKFILGTRFWDRQKTTTVIIDVEQKKYQMLLGREYAKHKSFYSHYKNKFAFDFKGVLIYVGFPESYPFDALKWRNEEIPVWTESEFWKQYEHVSLPEK